MEEKKPSSNGNFGFAVFIIAMVGLILYAKGIIVLPNKQEDVKPYVVTVETDSVTNIDTDSDDFNNIEELVCSNENVEKIYKAIQEMPVEYQLVIHLTKIEKLSYKDTARIMEKTESQIKTLAHNSKKKLKNQY